MDPDGYDYGEEDDFLIPFDDVEDEGDEGRCYWCGSLIPYECGCE